MTYSPGGCTMGVTLGGSGCLWAAPLPPPKQGCSVAEGEHTHHHTDAIEESVETLQDTVEELQDTVEDALEETESTVASVPHHTHEELHHLGVASDDHSGQLGAHETAISALRDDVNRLLERTETAMHEIAAVPETAVGETLEIPDQVIEPRKIHPIRHNRWPKWL